MTIVFAMVAGTSALAETSKKKDEKKPTGHCEKTKADGEIEDIEVQHSRIIKKV